MDRRQFLIGATAAAGSAVLPGPATALQAAASAVRSNARRYFAPLVQRNDYSGFVILERDGQTLVSEGFGFADDGAGVPHSADTHYYSASVGKMFTRAAVLELEKAGKLSRADALVRFVPGFPNGADITVQHLVDHRAGIARDLPPDTDLQRARSTEELVAMIAAMPIEGKPGSGGGYSNNGYRLLARVVEVAGGGGFDELIRELVLEPRRLRHTVPNLPDVRIPLRTRGFRPGPGWRSKAPATVFHLSNARGAGSFAITPADMLLFAKTLPLEQKDLDDAARTDGEGRPKPRSLGHDGFGDGYANLVYAYPDEKAYMISLSNMQTGVFTPMHGDLRRLLFGESVVAPALPEVAASAPGDLSRFVGDYDLRPGNPVRIRRHGELLTVDGGDGAHPLVPLGGERFFMRLRYATLRFEGPQEGAASMIRWAEGGGEFPLKRLA